MSMNSPKFSPKLFNTNKPTIKQPISIFPRHSQGVLKIKSLEAEVVYKKDFLHSIKDSKLHFTNCISELKDPMIDENIKGFANNPDIINENLTNIELDRQNGNRIKAIISRATGETLVNEFSHYIYESDLKLSQYRLNDRGPFRVFSIYAIFNIASDSEKHVLMVCLLDPYHLVCPVSYGANDKQKSMMVTFRQHENLNSSLEERYGRYFSTEKIIDPQITMQ